MLCQQKEGRIKKRIYNKSHLFFLSGALRDQYGCDNLRVVCIWSIYRIIFVWLKWIFLPDIFLCRDYALSKTSFRSSKQVSQLKITLNKIIIMNVYLPFLRQLLIFKIEKKQQLSKYCLIKCFSTIVKFRQLAIQYESSLQIQKSALITVERM